MFLFITAFIFLNALSTVCMDDKTQIQLSNLELTKQTIEASLQDQNFDEQERAFLDEQLAKIDSTIEMLEKKTISISIQ